MNIYRNIFFICEKIYYLCFITKKNERHGPN
jgi:hypothetical protein